MSFPKDFIWGVASSAYQTEGSPCEDGKGLSVWDSFSHLSGATFEGDTGDIACDAFHRYEDDIKLMTKLGIKAYRFSISWPRIFPFGEGEPEARGFAYYDKLVDCCIRNGIEPYITLYHWDTPQGLEDKGGWQNRETCHAFTRYCRAVAEHFRGRVRNYFTINEIQCVVALGHALGQHAPGKKLQTAELFRVWHNLLLAHGLSFREIREADPSALISPASTGRLCSPAGGTAADLEAARQATFAVSEDDWMFTHQMLYDPVLFGRYPETDDPEMLSLFSSVPQSEMELIKTDIDCLALNIYNGSTVRAGSNGGYEYVPHAPGCRRTAYKWPVTPEVMRYGPRLLWERYRKPVLISENGVSCNDFVYSDGHVDDFDRIDFLERYLRELGRSADDGVPVKGYLHWSFTDNFEWDRGFSERFGFVYVDYGTQERIPKVSFDWYAGVVADNGKNL